MNDTDKRFNRIYQEMTVEEKFEAVQRLILAARLKGSDPEQDIKPIGDSLQQMERWKWSNLHAQHLIEVIQFMNLCLSKERLWHLQTALREQWSFMLFAKEKSIDEGNVALLKRLREIVPHALKYENAWKPEFETIAQKELFPEKKMIELGLAELEKQILALPYSKKWDKRLDEVLPLVTESDMPVEKK